MIEITCGGVVCTSDFGLYDPNYSKNFVKLMSIYGSPQQVKAIFGLLSTKKDVEVKIDSSKIIITRPHQPIRFRGVSIGYGKQWGLIWEENFHENTILYRNETERLASVKNAIAMRKIPYDDSLMEGIVKILEKNEYIQALEGWGNLGGYSCKWDDDAICNDIAKSLFGVKKTSLRAA